MQAVREAAERKDTEALRHWIHHLRSSWMVLRTEAPFFMASQVMRITLKAYDHQLVDASAKKIIETVKKNGSQVRGPVPLPTKREVVTILRAVHKYKDSREQFEQRTHTVSYTHLDVYKRQVKMNASKITGKVSPTFNVPGISISSIWLNNLYMNVCLLYTSRCV